MREYKAHTKNDEDVRQYLARALVTGKRASWSSLKNKSFMSTELRALWLLFSMQYITNFSGGFHV